MTIVIWSDPAAVRARLQRELTRLTDVLARLPGVEQAWVTGSFVTGDLHATSDLDLLVIRRTEEGPVDRGLTMRRELAPRLPVDLFVYTPEEAAAGGRFVDDVRRRGRRVL